MKKVILFIVFLIILNLSQTVWSETIERVALDNNKKEFYFTGFDVFFWSGRNLKKYEKQENIIYKYDLKNQKMETFFTCDCHQLIKLALSRNNQFLGVILSQDENNKKLYLLNMKGEKVFDIDELVREYVWHPDSTKIIYMSGKGRYEGDEFVIDPDGLWLYDLNEKKKEKIAEKGWKLYNTGFDNVLYFWNGKEIIKYDMITKKMEGTKHGEKEKYSPDEKYFYYNLDGESDESWEAPYWSPFRIFDVKNNIDLPPEKISYVSERNPMDGIWSKDSRKIIFRGNISRENRERVSYIYDLHQTNVLRRIEGRIVGIDYNRTTLVIYRDGKFCLETVP